MRLLKLGWKKLQTDPPRDGKFPLVWLTVVSLNSSLIKINLVKVKLLSSLDLGPGDSCTMKLSSLFHNPQQSLTIFLICSQTFLNLALFRLGLNFQKLWVQCGKGSGSTTPWFFLFIFICCKLALISTSVKSLQKFLYFCQWRLELESGDSDSSRGITVRGCRLHRVTPTGLLTQGCQNCYNCGF